jgi:glycosyltransferase involved in cell wall biosynthesis
LNTVSPTYAREIQTLEYGFGLDGVLRDRASVLSGILNGVDYAEWDPRTDRLIPTRYGPEDLSGKANCKRKLLEEFGLPPEAMDRPLLGIVSRFTPQKGTDLLVEIAPQLVAEDAYLVALGTGDPEYEEFFRSVPEFERMLVRSGIRLLKYWFSITDEEQYLRFLGRIHDPLKQWKLSPMDLESRRRWEDYTRAKDVMLERSHIAEAPWWVVQAVDKKRARLNCIDHLLKQFDYREQPKSPIELPQREHHEHYSRQSVPPEMVVPEVY